MIDTTLSPIVLKTIGIILGYGLAGVLLGFAIRSFVMHRLQQWTLKTKWKGDDILVAGIRRFVVPWCVLAGLYTGVSVAAISLPLSAGLYKALTVIVILTVTLAAANILSGFVTNSARSAVGSESSLSIFRNITKIVVFSIGFLMILQHLGVSITPVLTALGVGGLAVALALQDTLSNLFAGIQIIGSNKVKPGDYVQLDSGQEGYVTDVTWRYTTIRALANNMIIVPNAKLAAALVTNYYRPGPDLAVLINVGVSYDSDLEKVERVTVEVAREVLASVTGGVTDFDPFIRYNAFDDSSIVFTVILRGKEYTDQYLIKHEFIKRLHQRYRNENITIPYPMRTIQIQREPHDRSRDQQAESDNRSGKDRVAA